LEYGNGEHEGRDCTGNYCEFEQLSGSEGGGSAGDKGRHGPSQAQKGAPFKLKSVGLGGWMPISRQTPWLPNILFSLEPSADADGNVKLLFGPLCVRSMRVDGDEGKVCDISKAPGDPVSG
jgi:hypothetical protein